MSSIKIKGKTSLNGEITVPGDKSISHRAVMLASIANGISEIDGFATGEDCINTIKAFRALGADIIYGNKLVIKGNGLYGLKKPEDIIDAGNSGTTMRLMLGILAGQSFKTLITGDESLRQRPMMRVTKPLREMGAKVSGKSGGSFAPLTIEGGSLHSIRYNSPVPSAQVKSAILLAGLYADGETMITEPLPSRDHTERMLRLFGADINTPAVSNGTSRAYSIAIRGGQNLKCKNFSIPGDISAASFFITASCIVPDSLITVTNAGVNPTRTGILKILVSSGAKIMLSNKKEESFEPSADITAEHGSMSPFHIEAVDIPGVLDEIPILAVAAAAIEGESTIRGAGELRIKETDRIRAIAVNLKKLGVSVRELENGLIINGKSSFKGAEVDSFGDHRMAMAMAMAALTSCGETTILNTDCINTSFPGFVDILRRIAPSADIEVR